jgi:hypothetical protein
VGSFIFKALCAPSCPALMLTAPLVRSLVTTWTYCLDAHLVGAELNDLLVSCALEQHAHELARGENLLDMLATTDLCIVCHFRDNDCCEVFDHRLAIDLVHVVAPSSLAVHAQFTRRYTWRISQSEFEDVVRQSSPNTCSSSCSSSLLRRTVANGWHSWTWLGLYVAPLQQLILFTDTIRN